MTSRQCLSSSGSGKIAIWLIAGLIFQALPCRIAGQDSAVRRGSTNDAQIAALKAEMNDAIERVKGIVNQPATAYARRPGMRVSVSREGWFHQGAQKPDFNTVDVRQTQQFPYAQRQYITSDLNPGVVFLGPQLEFNGMTKYFYTNYSLPKKRLTEAEMLEVNRLYRIIGKCEKQIAQLTGAAGADPEMAVSDAPARTFFERVPKRNYVLGGAAIALVLLLYSGFKLLRGSK